IRRGGLFVFPRLVAAEHAKAYEKGVAGSGIAALDGMLGGGPNRGTSTLILGPAGSGKSILSTLYAIAAARRGGRAAIFTFDESLETFLERSEGLGLDVRTHLESGLLMVQNVDPAELSPNEFAQAVRDEVDRGNARVVVIDSLNGYLNAMPEERHL